MPKEHNTIFGTTENSNFILNMKLDTMYKIIRVILVTSICMISVGSAMWLLGGSANSYVGLALLTCGGFASALWFGISVWKSSTPFLKNKSYFIIIGLAILTIISTLDSWSINTSFFGNIGRYEGLLALVSYMCLFLLATLVYKEHSKLLFDLMIGVGIVNCVVSILQRFGYVYAPFRNLDSIAVSDVYLPSGLVGSPIFLATLIVLFNGIALAQVCFGNEKKRTVFYGIALILFAVTAMMTNSIITLIGMPLTYILVIAFAIVSQIRNGIKFSIYSPMCRILCITAAFVIVSLIVGKINGFQMQDRAIAWQDSFFYLMTSGTLTLSYDKGLYETGWKIAADIIRDFSTDTHYWLLGTGPDCFTFPQFIHEKYMDIRIVSNSLDRPYNDYLYVAASRGIPALLLYVSLLAISVKRAFGSIKEFIENSDNWYKLATSVSVIAYIVVIFFGVSTIYVAPFFWIMLGLLNAKEPIVSTVKQPSGEPKPKQTTKKKKRK